MSCLAGFNNSLTNAPKVWYSKQIQTGIPPRNIRIQPPPSSLDPLKARTRSLHRFTPWAGHGAVESPAARRLLGDRRGPPRYSPLCRRRGMGFVGLLYGLGSLARTSTLGSPPEVGNRPRKQQLCTCQGYPVCPRRSASRCIIAVATSPKKNTAVKAVRREWKHVEKIRTSSFAHRTRRSGPVQERTPLRVRQDSGSGHSVTGCLHLGERKEAASLRSLCNPSKRRDASEVRPLH